MTMTRRRFLGVGLGAASLPFLPRLSFAAALRATPRRDRVLVLVELAGGNDGLQTVVPFGRDEYHRARPTLRLQKAEVLPLDDEFGLHKELSSLRPLFERRRLAVIHGVGYPGPDRSHFRSTDIWHTASLQPESRRSGWIGRFSELPDIARVGASPRTPALMIGSETVPILLVGEQTVAPQVQKLDEYVLPVGPADGGDRARVAAMEDLARAGGPSDLDFLRTTARSAQASAQQIQAAAKLHRTTADYPDRLIAQQLKVVAQLVGGGLDCSCYFLRQPGYDTHIFQSIKYAVLMRDLGDSLAAFLRDIEAAGAARRVVVVVTSEFGRRVEENASMGTDHGAAAPVLVLGAPVRGGLVGEHPSLVDLDDGDLRFTTDFRSVYATLLENWFEVPARPVLGADFGKLPLFAKPM
jgi:uncharacterized protein (DUF1501 family)